MHKSDQWIKLNITSQIALIMANKSEVTATEPEHASLNFLPPETVAALEMITSITCSCASKLRAVNEALEK